MKLFSTIAAFLVVLVWSTACQADITGNTLADDGDGVLTCSTYGFLGLGNHEFQLNIDGVHHQFVSGGPLETGDILGESRQIRNSIPNSPYSTKSITIPITAWTDYHAVICMSKEFTLDNITVDAVDNLINDWTYDVTQPTLIDGSWVGVVNYYAGTPSVPVTPVAVGDTSGLWLSDDLSRLHQFSRRIDSLRRSRARWCCSGWRGWLACWSCGRKFAR